MMLISIHSVYRYLIYSLFARHKRGHGIHSPFVYDNVTRVFRNKIDPDIVCKIENFRKKMLCDNKMLNVTDFGSGGNTNSRRSISSIAGNSSLPPRYCMLLASLAAEYGGGSIVELGTSLGISTLYLSYGSPSSTVHTAEGCPAVTMQAKKNFENAERKNVLVYNMIFDEFLEQIRIKKISPGLVYIDGDHRREPLLKYFGILVNCCRPDGVIVIDDIHSSAEMTRAWNEIRNWNKVSVTIDIFRMGIVFLRSGIARKDYTIRY